MDPQYQRWLEEIIGPAYKFYDADDARERADDRRTEAVIKEIREASRRQVEAIDKGFRLLADALRR